MVKCETGLSFSLPTPKPLENYFKAARIFFEFYQMWMLDLGHFFCVVVSVAIPKSTQKNSIIFPRKSDA